MNAPEKTVKLSDIAEIKEIPLHEIRAEDLIVTKNL